ncbi:MAG: AMP-binding protein [Sphingomonas bacterium]
MGEMLEGGFARIWTRIAAAQPEEAAVVQGDRSLSWAEFERRAGMLADYWRGCGLSPGASVTACMRNALEYPIAFFAAYKLGLTTFTCNYRYTPAELQYLFRDAKAEAIMFSLENLEQIAQVRELVPEIKSWIAVPDGVHETPGWAVSLDAIVAGKAKPPLPPRLEMPDDPVFLLYTGGTTGMPKGVVWRHADIIAALGGGAASDLGLGPCDDIDELLGRLTLEGFRPRALIGSPLMHGAGQSAMFLTLSMGGKVILLSSPVFDAEELWDEAEREGATRIVIVGEAFATPMLDALNRHPGRWRQPALKTITSTGAMWSHENKCAILGHFPHIRLVDSLASSEGPPLGDSITTLGADGVTGRFVMRDNCAVFTEDGCRVVPGSGEVGFLATGGRLPLGYFGDETKTAKTYRVLEGERWALAGDMATVDVDGSIRLLGRGSQCINTGGEKVFPEEVESALKLYDGVRDAIVLGLPDARFGERIGAVVELSDPSVTPDDLGRHLRNSLAAYKLPRTYLFVKRVPRLVNGKADLKSAKAALLAIQAAA